MRGYINSKLKNNYKIEENFVIIYLDSKGKIIETIIDLDDFDLVNSYKGKFYARWYKNIDGYYVAIAIRDNTKKSDYTSQRLHRIIMGNPEPEYYIDHINHNTLDNRKQNLRVSLNDENTKHRESKNSNNKSGYRNVAVIHGLFCVQLMINGKNTLLAKFKDVDEAGLFAEKMRQKYYGDFAGST